MHSNNDGFPNLLATSIIATISLCQTEPRSVLTTQKENIPPAGKTKSAKLSKNLFNESNGKASPAKYITTSGLHQMAATARTRGQKKNQVQS